MILKDRVVLVTGSGRGIGAAIARVCARQGASVVINYSQSREKAFALQTSIEQEGGRSAIFQADVRIMGEVENMIKFTTQQFGRIDGVVNNAISGRQHGSILESDDQDYKTAFDFGCMSIINMVRAVRPYMVEQGGGRIVNIVTEIWNMSQAYWSVYMAGKGAMVGISRSLACELGPDNITVNMVAPGWMADEKVDIESEGSKNFARSIPLQRHGSADEIGNACAFFMSDLATYVTGAYLPVTGGRITQAGL